MKTILLISVIILFSLTTIGQNLKALDDKYGFREAKLEMPISSFKNLELAIGSLEDYPNEKSYKVLNCDLHIGEYDLDGIDYWFYKGQLSSIQITISKGYSNQDGVLKVLEAAYGKGVYKKNSLGDEIYTWDGEKVSMTYTLGSNYMPEGDLQISCKKLMTKSIADKRLMDQQKDQEILKAAKKL